MFITEQKISQTIKITSKTLIIKSGTTLAKPEPMKIRITYKEITILLGVLVALLVMITLWLRAPQVTTGQVSGPPVVTPNPPAFEIPPAQILMRETAELLF